jgi:hypothetical protein
VFGIIVGVEFTLAAVGGGLLAVRRRTDIVSAWVALVVGVHLFPVAWLVEFPLIYLVAALVTVAALSAVPLARSRGLAG